MLKEAKEILEDDPFAGDDLDQEFDAVFEEFEAEAEDDLSSEEEPDELAAKEVSSDEESAEEVAGDESKEKSSKQPESEETLSPPASYTMEEKEHFLSLPPEQQKTAIRLEEGRRNHFRKQSVEAGAIRRLQSEIQPAMAHLQPYLQKSGVSFQQWVKGMADTQDFMDTDPVGAARAILNRLQVHPSQLTSGVQGQNGAVGGQRPVNDPRVEELFRWKQQQEQALEARDFQGRQQAVVSFQNEKDESGNLLRPFLAVDEATGAPVYPDFMGRIAKEIEWVKQQNKSLSHREALAQAYENAIHVTPSARKVMEQEREKQARAEANRKATEAKRRAVSPSGSRGTSYETNGTALTIDDEIDRLFA